MKNLSVQEVKQTDLVSYLAAFGHQPAKIRGNDYWYLSPLRIERTPSFKVNRSANVWYDHGSGQGGNIIDFGILYHSCTVSDFLKLVKDFSSGLTASFRQKDNQEKLLFSTAAEKKETKQAKILIINERPLSTDSLFVYLDSRQIPHDIAALYCKEIDFRLYDKEHTAIGFRNDAGGYELRNAYFKGSSSPKTSLFINNQSSEVEVFEGFFNFLSHQVVLRDKPAARQNYLILNSLSFFQKQRSVMEQHTQINLYLDRDKAGLACTENALKLSPKYHDQSKLYHQHKDLNQWLVNDMQQKSISIKQHQKQNSKQIKMNRYGRF